jgi:hypothetical protein
LPLTKSFMVSLPSCIVREDNLCICFCLETCIPRGVLGIFDSSAAHSKLRLCPQHKFAYSFPVNSLSSSMSK